MNIAFDNEPSQVNTSSVRYLLRYILGETIVIFCFSLLCKLSDAYYQLFRTDPTTFLLSEISHIDDDH